ncbi:MAG: hypothetical protein JWN00_6143 [Actinomycetia bacterium]|nr:hypothetical protein [Actinomycetes bacterium]
MTPLDALALLAAGLAAGVVNTVAGSGSLITFPALLALGFPPVVANVSDTVGLAAGSVTGALGYRAELRAQRGRLLPLCTAAVLGSLTGVLLLLRLPPGAFKAIVPFLVLTAVLLMAVQPWLARWTAARQIRVTGVLPVLVYAVSVYGGYFGAAQGVLLIALLGCLLSEDLQHLNGLKNLLLAVVNVVAALLYATTAHVAWTAALLLAAGSIAGGRLGASFGRRLPAAVLRWSIITIGSIVGLTLALT